uniref:Uncharacterized protein n=2 Tax=Strongyloides stercoralis TaxID=6248 RepID=A0AAF5D8E5_STRER
MKLQYPYIISKKVLDLKRSTNKKYGFISSNNIFKISNDNKFNLGLTLNNFKNESILSYNQKVKLPLKTSTPMISQITLPINHDTCINDISNVLYESTLKNNQSYIKKEDSSLIYYLKNDENNVLHVSNINYDIKDKNSDFLMDNIQLNIKYGKIIKKNQYNSITCQKHDGEFYLQFYNINNKHGYLYHINGFSNNFSKNEIVKRTTKAKEIQTTMMLSILSILKTTKKYGFKSIMIFHKDKMLQKKIKNYEKSLNTTENLVFKKIKEVGLQVQIIIILIDDEVKIEKMETVLYSSITVQSNEEFKIKNSAILNNGLPLCTYL